MTLGKATQPSWAQIALDGWLLGAEACAVFGLRAWRLAGGGAEACSEARLMVVEKIDSTIALTTALVTGQLGTTPRAVVGSTVSHYLAGVRANRRRLSRG